MWRPAAEGSLLLKSGLGDSIPRLVIRMLLLYVQQSPVQRAKQRIQEALDLLPNLMSPADTLSRCDLAIFNLHEAPLL